MNRLFQLLAVTVLLFAAATPTLAQQNDTLAKAQRLIDSGDNWKALKELDAVVKREPGNKDARFMRGIVLVQLNRSADAIQVFTKLTQDFPQLPEPYNNLAVLYAQEGQYDNAKEALLSAIKTHPSYATAHENLGDIYSTMARQAYNRALELDKANEAARVKLAMLDRIVAPAGGQQSAPAQVASNSRNSSRNTAPPVASTYPAPTASRPSAVSDYSQNSGNQADNRQAILGAVQNWSRAWANQDVNGYLASYSPEFYPPNGLSPEKWASGRRDRLSSPSSIQLTIQTPKVEMVDSRTAEVTFRQRYRADNYSDSVQKRLTMHKLNNRWMILREDVL